MMMTRQAKSWFVVSLALCLLLGLGVYVWRPIDELPQARSPAGEAAIKTTLQPGAATSPEPRQLPAESDEARKRLTAASPALPPGPSASTEPPVTDPAKGREHDRRPSSSAAPDLSYVPASEPAPHNATSDGLQLVAGAHNPDLVALVGTVRDFRVALGENPVGNNAEITRALLGDNARHAQFLPPEAATTNAAGELLDRWGHPYYFHAISGTEMEVHSAGPDGVMWNADDQAFR